MKAFLQLLVVQTFRPDRLLAMGHIFVSKIMGEEFQAEAEQDPKLNLVVEQEVWVTQHMMLTGILVWWDRFSPIPLYCCAQWLGLMLASV